jgi:hypothetical protein
MNASSGNVKLERKAAVEVIIEQKIIWNFNKFKAMSACISNSMLNSAPDG